MSEMPQPDQMPPGFPEGAPMPDPEQSPQQEPGAFQEPFEMGGAGEMPPEVQGDDDSDEFEARDHVAVQLLLAAEAMSKGAEASQGNNDAESAAKFASAALDFIKAHVLLAPIESADDLVASTQTKK